MPPKVRISGLAQVDPDLAAEWISEAAPNRAAMTKKQLYDRDRARNRVAVVLPKAARAYLAATAQEHHVSQTQLAAFLLTWAMTCNEEGIGPAIEENIAPARAISVENDLVILGEWLDILEG